MRAGVRAGGIPPTKWKNKRVDGFAKWRRSDRPFWTVKYVG